MASPGDVSHGLICMNLEPIIHLSRRYGSNPDYVLAGGGNTSQKEGDVMAVKASGVPLRTINEDGFVLLSIPELIDVFTTSLPPDPDEREKLVLEKLLAARLPGQTMRPSVETLLHALFPYNYVVHIHPALVNGLLCSVQGLEMIPLLFEERAEVLPYTTPGYILAQAVRRLFETRKSMGKSPLGILFLQNHGVFVATHTPEEVDAIYGYIFDTLKRCVRPLPAEEDYPAGQFSQNYEKIHTAILTVTAELDVQSSFISTTLLKTFLVSEETFAPLLQPFTPDHIVYAGAWPLFLSQHDAIDPDRLRTAIHTYMDLHGELPKIIAVQEIGVFGFCKDIQAAERACLLFQDAAKIAWYAWSFGGVHPMELKDIEFIRNWEVEKFRATASINRPSE